MKSYGWEWNWSRRYRQFKFGFEFNSTLNHGCPAGHDCGSPWTLWIFIGPATFGCGGKE